MSRYADVIGRYLYLTVQDIEYRVYVEEAGKGVPVVLQHTAGADNRQWRHLLEDSELTSEFRFIAADLPYHGKSLPPESVKWWEKEYVLSEELLVEFHLALIDALELDRPIYMGCSMGGHLALDLALQHPDRYRAVIGAGAALHSHGMERILPFLNHPEINSESKPALMRSMCSPTSPETLVRETGWVYSQGAPAVFRGDLMYYFIEHDLTETAHLIDTSNLGVWILNGEYDWATPPAAGEQLAAAIEGAHFIAMAGIGHFGMSEAPERFKDAIAPVLREAAALKHTPMVSA